MLLVPHFSPRRYFFAITVPPGFRTSEPGRAALRRYHWWVAGAIVISALAALSLAQDSGDQAVLLPAFLPLVTGLAAFLRERSHVRKHAAPSAGVREADLSGEHDHLPHWIVLALPPFAAPVAAAAYLRAHWSEIPARFPVHWNAHNQPNRWALKTPHAVYGPLLFGAGMTLIILLLALAMFYGSRRAPQRATVLKILVVCLYFLAFVFTSVGLMPVVKISPAWFLIPGLLFVAVVLAWSYKVVTDPNLPSEATPDEFWYLGSFYYNPQDPAIFVQKRIGFGYTCNFGNLLSWLILSGFAAGTVALIFALT